MISKRIEANDLKIKQEILQNCEALAKAGVATVRLNYEGSEDHLEMYFEGCYDSNNKCMSNPFDDLQSKLQCLTYQLPPEDCERSYGSSGQVWIDLVEKEITVLNDWRFMQIETETIVI